MRTSITSRVVPANSDVIAASLPARALRSVDFPAFGRPTIATSKPSRIRSANATLDNSEARSPLTPAINAMTSGATSTGTSSSTKSMVASNSAAARTISARQRSANCPTAPLNTISACLRCASVSASIRSESPSTCARSNRPFSSARRVNSPGSARRNPGTELNARSTAETVATAPCKCNSATSSPVKLAPSGKQITKASSRNSPPTVSRRRPATRGSGRLPPKSRATDQAKLPERRTTETPALPRAEANAKIVSTRVTS